MYTIPKLKLSVVKDGPGFPSDTVTGSEIAERILRGTAYDDGTVVDAKLVFGAALTIPGCCSLILAHSLSPSQADIDLTGKLTKAGELLDIKILDHLILSEDRYISFAELGLI